MTVRPRGGRPPGRPDTPRHLLVIAPQCRQMERLDLLEPAAAGLYEVLTDPALGGCAPGLPDGRSALLAGYGITSADVRAAVSDAVRHAARHRAVLVLALLGHGFVPGRSSSLYLMTEESVEDVRNGSVAVGDLLTDAADDPGVPGVLALVDTCHAGGAPPPVHELTGGTRNGRTRLALLMASAVTQPATGLSFTRGLTDLIVRGLPDAEREFGVADAVRALKGALPGQDVTGLDYDADGAARAPVWIARNARERRAPGGLCGRLALDELAAALRAVDPLLPAPDATGDGADLAAVREDVLAHPASPARGHALAVLDSLAVAVRTVVFLRGWLGADLTTARMRHALHTLLAAEGRLPSGDRLRTDVDIVDELVFNHPSADDDWRPGLTKFVALLGRVCGRPPEAPELHAWGARGGAVAELNAALAYAARRVDDQRLALVVSLHAALADDWPEELDAWLLRDGELLHHERFACPSADRAGAELAVEDAAAWAEDHGAALGLPLVRVDIALPAGLLLDWRPEEAGVAALLGIRYEVRLHWSRRLTPDAALRSIERVVRGSWDVLSHPLGEDRRAPVDWLGRDDVAEAQELRAKLRTGRYRRGLGLLHHPGADARLLDLLLHYTPVLLWPHDPAGADPGCAEDRHRCLDRKWWAMPAALAYAYRDRWADREADDDLADLRAVWDDPDWLRFCGAFRNGPPPARASDTAPEGMS
ncbi:hypothetical protein ACGFMM_26155 [Streptomyces sp. NPDC048604]|uniref:vWA-MoxR associated conflict system protein n=1 Tax=Streptomyces sp. NPDC048604 TaxID=3365578 RepID=UPI00371F02B7